MSSRPDHFVLAGVRTGDHLATGGTVAEPELSGVAEGPATGSWAAVDLSAYLDGTHQPPRPTMLPREDGIALLYPGCTHSFHGESESGKSLVIQHEAARLIGAGGQVLFLDFESDPASVIERLQMFGATNDAIRRNFTYVQPETDPYRSREAEEFQELLGRSFALAVIDGVTGALGLFGAASKDNDEVSRWQHLLPDALAKRTGAAVVSIDHVTKDADSRGRFALGGQAKMAGLTGAAYTVEVSEPLGRGTRGVVVLRVGKDRPGFVRPHAGVMRKGDRTQEVARVVIDSTGPTTVVTVEPPRVNAATEDGAEVFPSTTLMEHVCNALQVAGEPLSFRRLKERVHGREAAIREAVDALEREGKVTRSTGPRGALLHTLVFPYDQVSDPGIDRFRRRETVTVPSVSERPSTVSGPIGRETVDSQSPYPGDKWETVGRRSEREGSQGKPFEQTKGPSNCLGCGGPLTTTSVTAGETSHPNCEVAG